MQAVTLAPSDNTPFPAYPGEKEYDDASPVQKLGTKQLLFALAKYSMVIPPVKGFLNCSRLLGKIKTGIKVHSTISVISSGTKWSREIYALLIHFRSNRCVDPSTRKLARDDILFEMTQKSLPGSELPQFVRTVQKSP